MPNKYEAIWEDFDEPVSPLDDAASGRMTARAVRTTPAPAPFQITLQPGSLSLFAKLRSSAERGKLSNDASLAVMRESVKAALQVAVGQVLLQKQAMRTRNLIDHSERMALLDQLAVKVMSEAQNGLNRVFFDSMRSAAEADAEEKRRIDRGVSEGRWSLQRAAQMEVATEKVYKIAVAKLEAVLLRIIEDQAGNLARTFPGRDGDR